MKKGIRVLCVILVLSFMLAIPAYATDNLETRASAFFSSLLRA